MTATHKNRLVTTVSAVAGSGLGAFTISTASSGYRTFGAGDDGLTFDGILITEGTTWELRNGCVYTHSGTSLARGTLVDSSTGSAITFTSAAIVTQGGSAELANKTEMLIDVFGATEISVTGAVTATIGRMHHCTGTSDNYTVTLPPASGNTGKLIGFRMGSAAGLTKLVTLDGNDSETIDGATTRIMWATETAILLCDGSNWFKVAGKSVPMSLMLQRSTVTGDQSFSTATWTACATTEVMFGTTLMEDATNDRIKIVRPGKYLCVASFYCAGTTITVAYGNVGKNQAANTQVLANLSLNASFAVGSVSTVYDCAVDDYIVAAAYIIATSPRFESDAPTTVVASEIPEW